MRIFLLLLTLSCWIPAGIDAQPLSHALKSWPAALRKAAHPALIWCWATACGIASSDADLTPNSHLSVGAALTEHRSLQGVIEGTLGLEYEQRDDIASGGYLHSTLVGGEDYRRFSELRARIGCLYALPDYTAAGQHELVALSLGGYDYLDLRSHQPDGFVAGHLHLVGVESPVFGVNIGLGGSYDPYPASIHVGTFQQEDLEAWAGAEAGFSHELFIEAYAGLSSAYLDPLAFLEPLVVSIKIEQARTVYGDVHRLSDGGDGDFTAIWERLSGRVEVPLHEGEHLSVNLDIELSLHRQRLNAELEGKGHFSRRTAGKQIALLLTLHND